MGDERIANRELDCCANILGCEHEYTRPQLLSGYVRETRITLAGPLLSSHSLAERMDTSFPMRQFTCDSFGLGFVCCPKAWPNTRAFVRRRSSFVRRRSFVRRSSSCVCKKGFHFHTSSFSTSFTVKRHSSTQMMRAAAGNEYSRQLK